MFIDTINKSIHMLKLKAQISDDVYITLAIKII